MRRRSTIKLLFVAALGFFVWAILLAYPLVVSEEDVTIVSSGGAAKEDVAASTTELAEDMRISTETAALFNAFVLHPDFAKQGFCDLAARANLSAEMQRAAATPYNLQSWELSCSPTAPACTSFSTRRWVQYWEKAAQRISPHADAPTLAQRSCDNILLRNAPWCGFNLTQLMAPLLFRHLVHPNQVPPVVAAPDAQQYFSSASDADLLEAVKRNAQDILESSSSNSSNMNEADRLMIRKIVWKDWPQATAQQPFELSARDLEEGGGEVHLPQIGDSHGVLVALWRPEDDDSNSTVDAGGKEEHTNSPTNPLGNTSSNASAHPVAQEEIPGFHACMFGVRRNLSSTLEVLVSRLLAPMRPQRLHIVTNDLGALPPNTTMSKSEEMKLQRQFFNSFIAMVSPFASTFLAVRHDAASKHHCIGCAGFFQKELCRASILEDMKRGISVELVMVFRPDMYMHFPIFLQPLVSPTPVVGETTKREKSWQLSTKPRYTIVVDKGFMPASFGIINDATITKTTVVVHARVTFPMDLHWIGDPVVFGHWYVLNHWLQMYSVTTASGELSGMRRGTGPYIYTGGGWNEVNSGEMHHTAFFYKYIRPLFSVGDRSRTAWPPVEVKPFDFHFSLFRSDPLINKQIMSLPWNYATYQQQTIFLKYATKWETAECMHYTFVPREFNVTSFYTSELQYHGEIGRMRFRHVPMRYCQLVQTPPGLQTCFSQHQRIIYYKKGKNIHNPCKPYCGVIPIMFREGLCLHVGNKGPKRKFPATFSASPMIRNESGEVLRFNVVNPQYVRGDHVHIKQLKMIEYLKKLKETTVAPIKGRPGGTDEEDKDETLPPTAPPPPPPPPPPLLTFKRGSKKYKYVIKVRHG